MPHNLHPVTSEDFAIRDLQRDIEEIKNNHLAHMSEDIDLLSVEIADARAEFVSRFDKLDDRLWGMAALIVTTALGIVASLVFVG